MRTPKPSCSRFAAIALGFLFPVLMGGCPEFRNEAATAVESAESMVVVVVVAESDDDPHAAIISKRTVKA